MTIERLQHRIERVKIAIKDYESRKNELNACGQWSYGYWKGYLAVLEEWLDELIDGGNK